MSNLIKYNIDTAFTEDTTLEAALNSLTVGAVTGIGAAITNGTNLALLADLSIALASFTSAAPAYIEIHVIPLSGDGSTYCDLVAAGPTQVAVANVSVGASAKVFVVPRILILPGSFKFGIVNQAGASLAGSSHKAYYRLYNYTDNG